MIPEWLIDDTAEIGEARVFCTHTRMPMFVGELLPDDELQCGHAVRRAHDAMPLAHQPSLKHVAIGGIVVDDEDAA